MSQVERILHRRAQGADEVERVRARTIGRLTAGLQGEDRTDVPAPESIEPEPTVDVSRSTDDRVAEAEPAMVPVMALPKPSSAAVVDPSRATVFRLPVIVDRPEGSHDAVLVDTPAPAARPPIVVVGVERNVVADVGSAPATRVTPAPRRASTTRRAAAQRAVDAHGVASAYCPYCALTLDPPPKVDRRCDRCQQLIVVRVVDDGRTVHLTEAAVAIFEVEQERAATLARWDAERRSWLELADAAGAAQPRVERIKQAELTDLVVASARDLYLATVDHSVEVALRQGRFEHAAAIRRDQAMHLRQQADRGVVSGDEAIARSREAGDIELQGLSAMARSAVIVSAACCDACRADDGTSHSIPDELHTGRLPHTACTATAPCRCRWDLTPTDLSMIQGYLQRTGRLGADGGTSDGKLNGVD